ncbi:MAG: tetratricopeptide repeat protein [Saprospiraceae bacterium]|nr:tetratricopeptide repeat protein [Saprospiraceae bacterium]
MAGAIRDYEKALAFLAKINTDYPDYKRAPQALFMRAFTLDAELKRYNEAKVLYQEFLKKYPNDELAESAQFSLKNLGKSEEEIVQGFIEKQKQ